MLSLNCSFEIIMESIIILIDDMYVTIGRDNWYTIDGRKLQSRPTKKGIYLNDSRKMVVK